MSSCPQKWEPPIAVDHSYDVGPRRPSTTVFSTKIPWVWRGLDMPWVPNNVFQDKRVWVTMRNTKYNHHLTSPILYGKIVNLLDFYLFPQATSEYFNNLIIFKNILCNYSWGKFFFTMIEIIGLKQIYNPGTPQNLFHFNFLE